MNQGPPCCVFQGKNEFSRGTSPMNNMQAFWSFTKRRCAQFNGLGDDTFPLHSKGCEFRYSNKGGNLSILLTNMGK